MNLEIQSVRIVIQLLYVQLYTEIKFYQIQKLVFVTAYVILYLHII